MSMQNWDPTIIRNKNAKTTEHKPQTNYSTIQKAVLTTEDDVVKPKTVDREFSQQVIQARLAKKMNRKQLAQAMCIQESVVADVENGTAVYSGQLVNKFKTFLGIKNT